MGPNPTQGFLYNLKKGHLGDFEEQPNDNTALLDSARVLPNRVRFEKNIEWARSRDYLDRNFRKNTSKARLSNAQKYCSVILNGDASELMDLSFDKRIHAMKASSALSKFMGLYDEWRKIVGKYQLKWSDNGYGGGGSEFPVTSIKN